MFFGMSLVKSKKFWHFDDVWLISLASCGVCFWCYGFGPAVFVTCPVGCVVIPKFVECILAILASKRCVYALLLSKPHFFLQVACPWQPICSIEIR